jgi:hypothetical protein
VRVSLVCGKEEEEEEDGGEDGRHPLAFLE